MGCNNSRHLVVMCLTDSSLITMFVPPPESAKGRLQLCAAGAKREATSKQCRIQRFGPAVLARQFIKRLHRGSHHAV